MCDCCLQKCQQQERHSVSRPVISCWPVIRSVTHGLWYWLCMSAWASVLQETRWMKHQHGRASTRLLSFSHTCWPLGKKQNKTVADGTNKPACVFVTVTWCWCLVENAGDTAAQTKLTLNLKLWLWEGFPCYFPEYCSSILYVVQFHLLNNCQGF